MRTLTSKARFGRIDRSRCALGAGYEEHVLSIIDQVEIVLPDLDQGGRFI